MNVKVKALLLMGLVLLLGVGLGWLLGSQVGFDKSQVCAEARWYAERVKVQVLDTGEQFTFNLDDPLCKLLHYHEGGVVLATHGVEGECKWQLVLGQEDNPYAETKGDSLDVILKIVKYSTGDVCFAVSCFGVYDKKIYYENELKLETAIASGYGYAYWTD